MPLRLPAVRHVSSLRGARAPARLFRARSARGYLGDLRMPDSLLPAGSWGEPVRRPPLAERFLPPPEFVWGTFTAADGAVLRWGHLPVDNACAECVMVGGFGEFIEK